LQKTAAWGDGGTGYYGSLGGGSSKSGRGGWCVAGDGRNGRRINSKCVHAAAGRGRHGRFERGRREWEENEHLKLEKIDVPDSRGTFEDWSSRASLRRHKGSL
jgi:hypothetical protein